MSEKDKKNIPEVRFDGFDEEWERKILSDVIVQISTGLNPRDNFELNIGGENYYVTIKNFKQGQLFLDDNCDKVDDEALKIIQQRSQLEKGDVLFASIGRVGDCYLVEKDPTNWNINESVFALKPKKNTIEPEYLVHIIHSNSVLKQLTNNTTGSTFKSIKINDLKKANLSTPSIEEQKKIAEFFKQLDKLIELNEKKVEKLEAMKKSLLEKMFPVGGATTPKIRFDGFCNEWTYSSLKDITSLITKGTTPLDKSGNGNINFVKVENINSETYEILPEMKITEIEHNDYLKRSQLKENDILFSIAGTLGRVALVTQNILPANTNQALAIIRSKDVDVQYLSTTLKGNIVSDFIKRNPTVGAQPNLSLEQVSNLNIALTSKDEQHNIALCFLGIERTIVLLKNKTEKLRNLKISFLNKMIPHTHTHTTVVPAIRFKGFAHEWKCVELGNIANVYQPQTIAQSDCVKDGLYPVYGANGIIGYSNNFNHKTEQICLACRGSNCGVLNVSKPFSWINGNAMVINCDDNKNIVKEFLYYYLTTLDYDDITTGGAQPQITREPLLKLKVMLP